MAALVLTLCVSIAALLLAPSGAPEKEEAYLVRSYNGRAALFREGETLPLAAYDVYPVLLPEADAARLAEGIEAKNRQEALRVLEDLGA